MNPDDMRRLFDAALDGAEPVPSTGTDDIVAAGRRRARRRRAAIGAGAIAGIAALAAVVAIPVLLSGGPAPIAAAEEGEAEVPEGNSCETPDDQSDDQLAVAAAYGEALDAAMTAIGANLGAYCPETGPDYDGFHFDAAADGYRYEEIAVFADSGEDAIVRVEVLEPNDTPAEPRVESLVECGPDLSCTWNLGLNEEGPMVLLVEGTRTVVIDQDENPDGDRVPVRAAFFVRDDGVIVHVELEASLASAALDTTPEQLAEVAQAIPVGQDAPDVEQDSAYTLPGDAALSQALVDGIAEALPGAAVPAAADVVFVAQEETEAYADGYHYGNDATRIAYADATVEGEQVRFFLQVTPIDAPGDGGAAREAAEHYANCTSFECEYLQVNESTGLVHRTSVDVRPGPTSIQYRAADGWVVGVGVESLGSTEAPSIDFDTLDAIVSGIR